MKFMVFAMLFMETLVIEMLVTIVLLVAIYNILLLLLLDK